MVVTILVLVAVVIVAVIRGRSLDDGAEGAGRRRQKERAHLKTHVGFNRYSTRTRTTTIRNYLALPPFDQSLYAVHTSTYIDRLIN